MEKNKKCPEFPFFGAAYNDAQCVDGYLIDLDKGFWVPGVSKTPCPFCNKQEFIDHFTEIDDNDFDSMINDKSLSNQEKKEILDSCFTRGKAESYANLIIETFKHF